MTNSHIYHQIRTGPWAFLPVNVTVPDGAPKIAVVDAPFADAHPDLHRMIWRTSAKGTVGRQYSDRGLRDPRGRPVRLTEQLQHLVLGLPPFSPTYALNLDPLDCRAANIGTAPTVPEARAFASRYAPGSVVRKLEGAVEALRDVYARGEYYRLTLRRHRDSRLSPEALGRLLSECLSGVLKGSTLSGILEWMEGELGFRVHINQLRNILSGGSLRQPGFDYAALRASRPTARERAVERWRNRFQ